ncbi:hypothetical protein MBLNU457_4292t1 [Dothideomycetes sp. NU457]
MVAGKRKTKETSTSGRSKRARIVSSDESADDGIDEGREESENMLRQSASKKQEPKWHVEMEEQINQGKSELLQQLTAEKEKIALKTNHRNQEIRALVKSINPALFQPQPSGAKSHESNESNANNNDRLKAFAEIIAKHKASDEHVLSLTEHSSILFQLAEKIRNNYTSTSNIIAKATFPASITENIQKDRRKLLTALENGRRVAEADINILTGNTTVKMNEKKRRVNLHGKIVDEPVEGQETPGMTKWRDMRPVLREERHGTGDDKENQRESLVKKQVEGKSVKRVLVDACKGVEKITRGLPEAVEEEGRE